MRPIVYLIFVVFASCVSTKNTIQNIDVNAPRPLIVYNKFVLTKYATDSKYGFHEDFPVNVFYYSAKNDTINAHRFLNALTGPNGEPINFKKIDICCPYTTKNNSLGAGYIDIYEVSYQGLNKPLQLYINIFEPGEMMVPLGFDTLKVQQ